LNGKRGVAASMLASAGITGAINRLRPRFSDNLTILAYHRILDVADEDRFPFDIDLVSASTRAFREQMQLLRRHFNPITFATLLDHQQSGAPLPSGSVIVTFDDGFADNYRHAYPILRETGVPATIFLVTDFIDRQQTIWFESLAYRVMQTACTSVHLPGAGDRRIPIPPAPAARRKALQTMLDHMKRVPNGDRLGLLAHVEEQLGVPGNARDAALSTPMTWDQIREMSQHGIEFGSHSVTHPILSMLTSDELQYELQSSRARIESQTSKPAHVLAYPVGGRSAFNPEVKRAAKAAGYRLAVSYLKGVENPRAWDPFEIRRVHVERYIDMNMFAATLALPEFFIPRSA
jgi:peptidoglycan/xylan/chitin deacetylase (PgdA/CDA1 family)